MEIFDVFSMNGIKNYPAAGENFLENVILKVSQTHFPRISTPRRGQCPPPPWLRQGGHKFFKGGGAMPPPRGAVKYPGGRYPPWLGQGRHFEVKEGHPDFLQITWFFLNAVLLLYLNFLHV